MLISCGQSHGGYKTPAKADFSAELLLTHPAVNTGALSTFLDFNIWSCRTNVYFCFLLFSLRVPRSRSPCVPGSSSGSVPAYLIPRFSSTAPRSSRRTSMVPVPSRSPWTTTALSGSSAWQLFPRSQCPVVPTTARLIPLCHVVICASLEKRELNRLRAYNCLLLRYPLGCLGRSCTSLLWFVPPSGFLCCTTFLHSLNRNKKAKSAIIPLVHYLTEVPIFLTMTVYIYITFYDIESAIPTTYSDSSRALGSLYLNQWKTEG